MITAPPLDTLRDLMRHMEWADALVWRAILAHPAAVQDPRLGYLLRHLHGVQRGFVAVWTSQSLDVHPASLDDDLPAVYAGARAYYDSLDAVLSGFDAEALRRPVVMPGLEPYEQQMGRRFDAPTLGETLLQVAMHSTYHRGQVNARLREVGGEPPPVDYIAWIWFGRPAAEWTVAA